VTTVTIDTPSRMNPVLGVLRLREQQIEQLAALATTLTVHDRAQLISACGSGKTLTARWHGGLLARWHPAVGHRSPLQEAAGVPGPAGSRAGRPPAALHRRRLRVQVMTWLAPVFEDQSTRSGVFTWAVDQFPERFRPGKGGSVLFFSAEPDHLPVPAGGWA